LPIASMMPLRVVTWSLQVFSGWRQPNQRKECPQGTEISRKPPRQG
jgi:hypothetical protein